MKEGRGLLIYIDWVGRCNDTLSEDGIEVYN